jgi:lipopolysaccharide biosynthesis glycosyltransferase
MEFLAISMVVLSLAVLGALGFSLSRRSRVKKQLGRRWYQTRHEFHAFEMLEPSGKAAWVTSCNREYFEGVLKLHRSMRHVKSEFPLVCFCTDSTTGEQERALIDEGIITKRVALSSLTNPYKHKWLEAFVKLECWKLTDYDKVCWIDSDTIQLQNADELMNISLKPHGIACAVDHEVFPEPSEHVRLRMIQTGVVVLRPSSETYEMIKAQLGKVESVDGSDQGFLTSYYALSSFDDVRFFSSAYNYMKRGLKRHPQFDLSEIKILHYVGHPKPWNGGEPGYERLQRIWDLA